MNRQEKDILQILITEPFHNQRVLSERSGHSLGIVNRSLKNLTAEGYLTEDKQLTGKAKQELAAKKPQSAVILAAGYGMRMVPINTETPKGLLEVKGEALIERLITQLQEAHITEIYVVVGFLKERYEYLIDKYHVNLIINTRYAAKNNMFSLYLALPYLTNSYIIPCDIWCRTNPFHAYEMYSWYMISEAGDIKSMVHLNRNLELRAIAKGEPGNRMIGIAYLEEEDTALIRDRITRMVQNAAYDDAFWELALLENGKMLPTARIMKADEVYEINTFEQLRELDSSSAHLQTKALEIIAQTFQVMLTEITDITVLKKGMTNRSFLFRCRDRQYIMRIPGEGTDKLISRMKEAEVYRAIQDKGISDTIVYLNAENGYKITEYIENARVCNPQDENDVKRCMRKLREFHRMKLRVEHEFDLFGQIEFYEELWGETKSVYRDYAATKRRVYELKDYIDSWSKVWTLSHIDSVPDNFLFTENGEIKLIDWEYAGMQDAHIDIAMFAVYAYYTREQIDWLIDLYFDGRAETAIRIKIYCYVAACGLLWSNWSEYKQQLGIELGEYSIRQYRYAKEFYNIAVEEMKKWKESEK